LKFGIGGIRATANVPNYKEAVELIKFCDSLGYDYSWFSTDSFREYTIVMAICAMETSRLKMGPGVANPYSRHPLVIARTIATLDEVSNGRAFLGLATGDISENLRGQGYDTSNSYERVRESAIIIKRLLSGENVTFKGKYFNVEDISLGFECRRNIPIYIAGGGLKILEVAGEVADGVILTYVEPDILKRALEPVEKGAAKAGKSLKDIEIVCWTPVQVTKKDDNLREQLRSFIAMSILLARRSWVIDAGISLEQIKALQDAYVTGSHYDNKLEKISDERLSKIVTDRMYDLKSIIGPKDYCIERIRSLEKAGASQLVTWVIPKILEEKKDALKTFAHDVIPAFR